eukprot:NODE_449_length_8428_cov_0.343979.p4 type:complete len:116 gc:universal NODE_449_length_8428_cov_0.343979:3923-4270(+)
MNSFPFESQDPFMRLHKESMVFDPLDELMRSQDSKAVHSLLSNNIDNNNTTDSQQRAKVAKQRREKLTITFERLKELLIPFGADPNAGRTKLLDYATELVTKISQDNQYHNNREQ